jgi:hypothetical protein
MKLKYDDLKVDEVEISFRVGLERCMEVVSGFISEKDR